jgi:hypothetical protein
LRVESGGANRQKRARLAFAARDKAAPLENAICPGWQHGAAARFFAPRITDRPPSPRLRGRANHDSRVFLIDNPRLEIGVTRRKQKTAIYSNRHGYGTPAERAAERRKQKQIPRRPKGGLCRDDSGEPKSGLGPFLHQGQRDDSASGVGAASIGAPGMPAARGTSHELARRSRWRVTGHQSLITNHQSRIHRYGGYA